MKTKLLDAFKKIQTEKLEQKNILTELSKGPNEEIARLNELEAKVIEQLTPFIDEANGTLAIDDNTFAIKTKSVKLNQPAFVEGLKVFAEEQFGKGSLVDEVIKGITKTSFTQTDLTKQFRKTFDTDLKDKGLSTTKVFDTIKEETSEDISYSIKIKEIK